MKKISFIILTILPLILLAQVPSYYNDVDLSLSGIPLKDELATKIISTHTRNLSYSQVWSSSKITDLDPSNSANVILIYGYDDNDGNYITDRTRSKNANGGTNGTDWNREHTYAKSLGTPNLGTSGPGSDAHHLRPADVTFNGQRSSKRFATGSGNAGDSNSGWYPGDEWKGDVARMMMYMYLRYGNRCLPTGVGIGSASATPDSMIDLFLQWNADDPVSQFEINRNDYHGISSNSFAQGNRNPFIDNPAFATQIWGGPQAEDIFGNGGGNQDTQAPTVPTNLSANSTSQTTTNLTWTSSTDNVAVTGYDVFKDGTFLNATSTNSFNVTGLVASTTYSFTVKAKDAAGNSSASSSAVSVTTLPGNGGGNSSELFFSEYVEGSSYNKAVEIANSTGNSVDLSIYKLKKQSNGAGSWSSGISLSGTLANGAVYVAANNNASAAILTVADLSTTNSALSFNGNDAVGLFKNNVLIDIVGTFNGGSANFGKDQTLRRKATVTSPSTTFDKAGEWDSFPKNTFDGLGSHTTSGGGNQDTQAPSVPTSLTASSIVETGFFLNWNNSTDNVAVTGYDVFKDGNFVASTTTSSYNVTGLNASTSYSFTVKAKDAAGNNSVNSSALNVSTIDTTVPSAPSSLTASNTTQTSTNLSWTASTDNVAVIDYDVFKDGVLLASTSNTSYNVTGLTASTSYSFTVKATDAANNNSNASNTATITTQSSGGGTGGNELFISEYVEGSSNNKALEIVNLTGSSVSLTGYSLKRNTNGGASWGSALNLSGQLGDGAVFVIANSNATATILNVADLTSSASAMAFNGNDPVGLFHNNVLIDIIGNFNGGSANFAANTTLRRKSTITNPNATYTVAEWDSFASDTFDGLGSHTSNGGGSGSTTTDILLNNSFETGLEGWTDGGTDCYRINTSRSFDGNYSIRIRDNSGTASAMTSSTYDVSSYDNLEVTFNFYSYSMEFNEDFWLRYFDGSTWQTVQTFARGTDFNNNEFTAVTVNISDANYNFPENAQFRFQCDASSNADQIYIDNVVVTATSGVKSALLNSIVIVGKGNELENDNLFEIEATSVYPNPVKDSSLLKAEFDIEDQPIDVKVLILNAQGKVIKTINLDSITDEYFEKRLDLSQFENGLYFISISTSNGFNEIKRIVVK